MKAYCRCLRIIRKRSAGLGLIVRHGDLFRRTAHTRSFADFSGSAYRETYTTVAD
jgi:hypothetical protein